MVAGWLFFIGAVLGWYTATAMLFEAVFHRSVLPLGLPTATESASRRSAGRGESVTVFGQTPAPRRS